MKDLRKLIEEEGKRNNYLRDAFKQGKFPSRDIAREIGSDNLFELGEKCVDFRIRVNLDILQSNYHLVKLMERYIAECKEGERVSEEDLGEMQELIKQYQENSDQIITCLVQQQMRGYDRSW